MVQFMKAMRDEKGKMIRNAHLIGFFRRICKLLFLRTKPIFVFDGGTPVLKQRTAIACRRQRKNALAKVRMTAEKLLLNHLKRLKLKELANDIKNQRLKQNSDAKGQKKSDQVDSIGSDLGRNNPKELDKVSRAKFAAEEDKIVSQSTLQSRGAWCNPELIDEVDPSVLAALPQSMQRDILSRRKGKKTEGPLKDPDNQKQYEVKDKGKGKGIPLHEHDFVGCSPISDEVISRKHEKDKVDEMLAASIAAEETEKLLNDASTSVGAFISEEDDDICDEDEEMILPETHGKVDPAVLASLPPSMQLDLLGQTRERLIAKNRQKYQKVKKELLQMFGLPYMIAPMEAEAQCAYLELAKLVDVL